jgi:hypothetical protein
MKRRSVTLVLLWEEYRAEQVDGYGYSRFCDLYGEWRKTISATMRQTHPAGEKLFVDYAGDTVPVLAIATRYDKLQRFSCRGPAGRRYDPPRLKTGPSQLSFYLISLRIGTALDMDQPANAGSVPRAACIEMFGASKSCSPNRAVKANAAAVLHQSTRPIVPLPRPRTCHWRSVEIARPSPPPV